MVAGVIEPLYTIGKSTVFCWRNGRKAYKGVWYGYKNGGDVGRLPVAVAQLNNAATAISTCNNTVGNAAKRYVRAVENAAASNGVLGYTAKGLQIASKYVNPLIVLSSTGRVAFSKDKPSEAINQGCALTTMFTSEKIAASLLTANGRAKIEGTKLANAKAIKTALDFMKTLDRYAAFPKSSKVGKIAIPLVKAGIFVCASIAGYEVGAKIADIINTARKEHALLKAQKQSSQPPVMNNTVLTNPNGKFVDFIS